MPRENYQIPFTEDTRTLVAELNRIFDSLSRRLNLITQSGDNIDFGAGKLVNIAAGVDDTDAARLDQAFLLEKLADVIFGTSLEIEITDNGDNTITIGLIDPLAVSKGGTGAATLTDHGLLLGSGVSAITALAAATNGQIPIGSTGADPVLATITGTANEITVTNGVGSITLSLPGSIKLDAATASLLLATDGDKKTVSVADLTAWIAGTVGEIDVADDGDGSVTLSGDGSDTDFSVVTAIQAGGAGAIGFQYKTRALTLNGGIITTVGAESAWNDI